MRKIIDETPIKVKVGVAVTVAGALFMGGWKAALAYGDLLARVSKSEFHQRSNQPKWDRDR